MNSSPNKKCGYNGNNAYGKKCPYCGILLTMSSITIFLHLDLCKQQNSKAKVQKTAKQTKLTSFFVKK